MVSMEVESWLWEEDQALLVVFSWSYYETFWSCAAALSSSFG